MRAHRYATAAEIGDEPLQISLNIPEVIVAVCEDRCKGIDTLIKEDSVNTVILDDAFQHRKVTGSLYILITTFDDPFYTDLILPAGNLRESASNKNRADIIIVSKCPSNLSKSSSIDIISKIAPLPHQSVFFTYIAYGEPKLFHGDTKWDQAQEALLVTGIVNPTPLKAHLQSLNKEVTSLSYKDHHSYSSSDIGNITKKLTHMGSKAVAVTTSKDKVKIQPLMNEVNTPSSIFEIPIEVRFLFNEMETFHSLITSHICV